MPLSCFLYRFIPAAFSSFIPAQFCHTCTITIKRSILFRKAEVIGWLFTKPPFPFLCLYFSSFPQLFSSCLSLFHQGCEWQRKLRQQVFNRNETSSPLSLKECRLNLICGKITRQLFIIDHLQPCVMLSDVGVLMRSFHI